MLSVIIPVYNEKNTILEILERVKKVDITKQIIIVDDGSTDGTSFLLKKINDPAIKILFHEKNCGKGCAVRTGIKSAEGDIILIQDADLEYDPNDYRRLIEPITSGKASIVYGSRYLSGALGKEPMNAFRFGRWLLTFMTNILYGAHITDEPCGYKVFKADVLKGIQLTCRKFEFCPEVTAKVLRRGYKIFEVPINYYSRTFKEGKKITYKDGFEAVITLMKYRFWR